MEEQSLEFPVRSQSRYQTAGNEALAPNLQVDFLLLIYNPSLLLCCMFWHDCLGTCCLGVIYAFVLHSCICACSAQLSMFHVERRSRKTLSIISVTAAASWKNTLSIITVTAAKRRNTLSISAA